MHKASPNTARCKAVLPNVSRLSSLAANAGDKEKKRKKKAKAVRVQPYICADSWVNFENFTKEPDRPPFPYFLSRPICVLCVCACLCRLYKWRRCSQRKCSRVLHKKEQKSPEMTSPQRIQYLCLFIHTHVDQSTGASCPQTKLNFSAPLGSIYVRSVLPRWIPDLGKNNIAALSVVGH